MTKVRDVHVDNVSDDRYAIGWKDQHGFRYHIWQFRHKDAAHNSVVTIYKNVPDGAEYKPARKLDPTATSNIVMLTVVGARVKDGDLINKAIAEYERAKEAEETAALERMARKKHALELFVSMRDLLNENQHFKYELTADDVRAILEYAPKSE